jgi:hypothetical protein
MTFPLPPRFSVNFPKLDPVEEEMLKRESFEPKTAKECVFVCHRNAFLLRRFHSNYDFEWIDAYRQECLRECAKVDSDSTCKNMIKFSDQCKSFFALGEEIENKLDKKVI